MFRYSDPALSPYLKHLWLQWQLWVFLEMILQAWHTFPLEVSPILLGRIVQALPGWMGNIGAQPFSGLSRDAPLGPDPDSGWTTPGHRDLSKPLLCFLGGMLQVVVLLNHEQSWKSFHSNVRTIFTPPTHRNWTLCLWLRLGLRVRVSHVHWLSFVHQIVSFIVLYSGLIVSQVNA